MKRHIHDMSIQVDSDSDFTPSSQSSRNAFALNRRTTRTQPETLTDQHSMKRLRYTTIFDLARPMWPANDVVTPAISERKIRELECGNDEERLMAAFARHVINPGRNRRTGSTWVSHRSLRKAFPEHFGHSGFHPESTWKTKTAGEFGLPDLFFRSVDDSKASLSLLESVDDLVADLRQAPASEALTDEEHQQLRNRNVNDTPSALFTVDQPQSCVTSGQRGQRLQDEGDSDTIGDGSDIPRPPKRLRTMSSAKSQLGDKTELRSVLGSGLVTPNGIGPPGTELRVSPEIKHITLPHRLGLSTPNTMGLENNNTRVASQKRSDQELTTKARILHEHTSRPSHQEQVDITDNRGQSNPVQSINTPATNDVRAVRMVLIPKLCDILKDFPTSPEDASFLPLLRQLVKMTVANDPQAIEERYLDLLTHVHCSSSPPTDQVETASLVRPVLKILSRHRNKLAVQTHSQLQRDISSAARANNLDRLRVVHADLLLFEAHYEGDPKLQ